MDDDLTAMTAVDLAASLRAGDVSAREVVSAHLARIEAVNPSVNAVVTLCAERALDEARAADDRHAAGGSLPPLHGIPVLVKDTHDTQGVRTTYGSPIYAEHVPDADELVVARMRAAGGIVVGKSNVPEFGAGSHTFNPVFGATRNPYDPARTAGGSSGGAAAALAARLIPLADGSDMGGSLRNPAAFTNVVGFRPSPGRVPTHPAELPYATLTVQGPLARTVADAALLLSVLAGPDPRSPIALETPGSAFAPPLPPLDRPPRVAFSPDLGGLPVDPRVTAVLGEVAAVLEGLGATVRLDAPDLSEADDVFRTLRAWQFAATLGGLLDAEGPRLKATLAANIAAGRALTGADLARAELARGRIHERTHEFFRRYDLLLAPATQVMPFPIGQEYPTEVNGVAQRDYLDWMRAAYLVTVTGCPAVSVPAGFADGLPVGAQLVAAPRADAYLLRAAAWLEAARPMSHHRPPARG